MPEKKEIYLIVAIRRDFSIVDFTMPLERSFIYNSRGDLHHISVHPLILDLIIVDIPTNFLSPNKRHM